MWTTLTLDDDVYEAAVRLSRISGKRLGEVVSLLARRGLILQEPVYRRGRRRFPTFDVPDGAPRISVTRLQHALEEE
jgi:hypothetical protein